MARIDCLFLHVPKLLNYYRPFHRFFWINFIPMGLFGLADLVHRQGLSAQIVHLGIEAIENRAFSILSYLKEVTPRMVALDLHWHHQSYDVIETARAIKAVSPEVSIFLGGFTASFFHEEIMKNFDFIDGIIRGEAETPILELTGTFLQGRADFFSIPNLTWRRKGRVFINPLSYIASAEDLNRLSFTNLPLLKNYLTYIRHGALPFYVNGYSKKSSLWMSSMNAPVFHLPVGRGCPVQCTWCEGSIANQQTISGRKEVVFRGIEHVLQSIKEAVSYGYSAFHISFDPYPHQPDYYLDLFARIREEKLRIDCCFESFGLPTLDFVKAFKETFPGPGSLIALSPGVGSARVRTVHKGYAYSNRALMESLRQMEKHRVFCDLFFILGLPFETDEDVHQGIRFQREIRRRFGNVRAIRTFTVEMAPGSPWHLDPESFGVKTSLRDFMDFYHYHSGEKSPLSSLGYWIPGYFPEVADEEGFEKALQKIKCRHFCFIFPNTRKSSNAFWGRRLCDLSHLVCTVKDWVGNRQQETGRTSRLRNDKKRYSGLPSH